MGLKTGAVIHLRNRLWRVDRVEEQEFLATPLDGRDVRRWRFSRALEEGLVQAGALSPPDPGIISDPARQDLLLRAYRLGLIHGSAPFLGLQRSRAIPERYQLVPLLLALEMPRVRLLIGDDVGVGKSVEAGLIISELFARGVAARLLVVVPAALRDQWCDTLARFFHLDAVIMAGHTRPALERQLLPGQSPWDAYPVVVASIDYLKRRIGEVLSHRWDIVLVDEAHIAARPHAWAGASALQKERWEFLEAIGASERVRHLLLLTATPHPGYTDCFASLLEALNPETVRSDSIQREIARKHVVQRRRSDIKAWFGGDDPFPERDPHDEIVPLTKAEKTLLERLRAYAEELGQVEGRTVGNWVALHLQRRALSSPLAIRCSLDNRLKAVRKRARAAAEQEARFARQEAESVVLDQDSTGDFEDEERWARLDVSGLVGSTDEGEALQELIGLARKVTPKQDGKLKRLLNLLPKLLRRHPQAPRALVFTRYKDTLEYLGKQLDKEASGKGDLEGIAVFTIHGDLSQKERRTVFRAFERADRAVCVATDCISEGLDLQRACAELVHYELPWNPNRLEQRNGRLDRYGQPEGEVGIWTLVREDPLDVTILEVLVRKAAEIRREHGFCPVFFSSARELKRLIAKHGRQGQQIFGFLEERDLAGAADDALDQNRIERIKQESFYGQEDVRLPRVEKALAETYRTVGSPEEIEGFVRSGLAWSGGRLVDLGDGTHSVELAGTRLPDLGEQIHATFKPRLARDDPELELLALAHPLLRRLIEEIRQAAAGSEEGRVAVRGSRSVKEVAAILHLLARYVTDSDPAVLMEELIPLVYLPYSGKVADVDAVGLLREPAAPLSHKAGELEELARDALQAPGLDALVDGAIERRRRLLLDRQSEIAALAGSWAEGMQKLTVASTDWLTLTVLAPAHA